MSAIARDDHHIIRDTRGFEKQNTLIPVCVKCRDTGLFVDHPEEGVIPCDVCSAYERFVASAVRFLFRRSK